MKARDFNKIVTKLGMETRESAHHHAWLVHNGVTIVRTKRSHGDRKFVPEHLIRKQLHVNQQQFSDLQSCAISKEKYLKILTDKGIISKPTSEIDGDSQRSPGA